MKLDDLIKIADEAYPDGMVGLAYENKENPGDSLAYFIAVELRETFESKTSRGQLERAIQAMETAREELSAVITSLEEVKIIYDTQKKNLPTLIGQYKGFAAKILERELSKKGKKHA